MDSEPLSDDDAHILGLESAAITGHTLKLMVLDPGPPLDLDRLRAGVADRLAGQPRATEYVALDADGPSWVPDEAFDIAAHVRRRTAPEAVTRDEMWRIVGELMAEHLDHRRPLWTLDVIGPLPDGREAIAARIHHAMADGIAGVRFLEAVLFDPHTDAQPPAAAGMRTTATPSRLTEARRLPEAVLRELGRPVPRSPFDRPVGAARELAFAALPLAGLKDIGATRPAHATVNDVLLAVVAGGLRSWLVASGSDVHRLRAQVPVSLHHRDEVAGDLGNRDSFINVDLPLAEPDPLARLDAIRAETATRKRLDDAEELYDLFHALGRLPHVGTAAQRLAGSAREFAVAISNVPGPAAAVAVAGRRVAQLFSSSEPAAHHALRISAISCAGDIGIGLCTDPNALADLGGLAEAIEASYAELSAAALG
ncbi:WS/DGAT domain-containing protein [Mycobacterium sp. Y57]|uniref:wax ester/triacylglycerol synthase domain-containing protein n=1 Tax=Mycolicibacterium xanthum TaxID=2796469 RepID=UPI001C84822D|nr:wax ester/triacylglycerol synthase domain-containing protein [Mycolicibacterium xanthum]MBX7432621.1 WS/DGAT domain-containing protein [Mycolicibacterium xanthum]